MSKFWTVSFSKAPTGTLMSPIAFGALPGGAGKALLPSPDFRLVGGITLCQVCVMLEPGNQIISEQPASTPTTECSTSPKIVAGTIGNNTLDTTTNRHTKTAPTGRKLFAQDPIGILHKSRCSASCTCSI